MISLYVFQLQPISIQALSFFIVFSFLFLIGQGIHYKEPPKTKTAPLDLEQLPCAVATLNQQGQIIAQNEAFEHLFSAKTKHPCWEANQHKLANLLSETQPKENQFSQLNLESISEKNKSFYVPFYSLQKTRYLFLFIPAPKQLQVSDWFSDWKKCLAHEMYTPLSSIQGFSKLLQEKHPDNHKFTHIITQHTHRMIASMRRFLDKQEPQEKKIESCLISNLFEQHLEHTKPLFKTPLPEIKLNDTTLQLKTDKNTLEMFLSQLFLDCAKEQLQTTCFHVSQEKEAITIECICTKLPFHLPIYQELITSLNGILTLEPLSSHYNLKISLAPLSIKEHNLLNA